MRCCSSRTTPSAGMAGACAATSAGRANATSPLLNRTSVLYVIAPGVIVCEPLACAGLLGFPDAMAANQQEVPGDQHQQYAVDADHHGRADEGGEVTAREAA